MFLFIHFYICDLYLFPKGSENHTTIVIIPIIVFIVFIIIYILAYAPAIFKRVILLAREGTSRKRAILSEVTHVNQLLQLVCLCS